MTAWQPALHPRPALAWANRCSMTATQPLARRAQRRAARGRHARGRPAADPRRRRHGQDDDAVRARGVAAGRGRAGRADPAAHVHAARGARDGRARACARRAGRARRRPGRRRHVPLGRPPDGSPARLLARPRSGLRRARRAATRPTCSTSCARSTVTPRVAGASRARRRCSTSTRAPSTRRRRWRRSWPSRSRGARSTARRSRRSSAPTERASARSALLDLDDLLLYWRALAADEVIGPRMADAFDHVLVDEYQDVNGLQVDIVRSLRGAQPGLTVVGDDFQAIYGFRAASARHILEFPEQFPGRAHGHARAQLPLDRADPRGRQRRLRHRTDAGFPKGLWTEREGGQPPELVFPRDEGEQASEVCDRVLAAREEGMELRDAGGPVPHRPRLRPARARADAPRHPVRQVRRPALPRRRARQGLHRAAAPHRQPGRRAELVSPAAAARRRRPDPRAARPRRAPRAGAAGRRSWAAGRRRPHTSPTARASMPTR